MKNSLIHKTGICSLLTVLILAFGFDQALSQETIKDSIIPSKRFLLTGNFFTLGTANFNNDKSSPAFIGYSLNPIALWKISDKIFFEGEIEIESSKKGSTHITLGYLDISYLLNKYMTINAGNFLSPFGTFQERTHPAWINKMPDVPLGFGHDGLVPSVENGLNIRGGIAFEHSKINYVLYISNGPHLRDGLKHPLTAGSLEFESDEDTSTLAFLNIENYHDNNSNKAVGGRLGILPFANSSMEFGGSVQRAGVGDKNSDFENISASIYALDLSYIKGINLLKGEIDFKAQLNYINVDKAQYVDTRDTSGSASYTFDNRSENYYLQFAYRPVKFTNSKIKNTGINIRYSSQKTPDGSLWKNDIKQITIGFNYWLNWHSVLKVAFQNEKGNRDINKILVQWAIGF